MNHATFVPGLLPAEKTYFDFLKEGRWHIQRCLGCSSCVFYPRQYCPHCGHAHLEWITPAGAGTVYSLSKVHHPTDPQQSHVVALVVLDEGVRVMGVLSSNTSLAVCIGDRVRAALELFAGENRLVFQAES